MSAKVSDWLLEQIQVELDANDGGEVPNELTVVRSYCTMRRLLEAVVAGADLERAA
ncbi:hypothetical protein [Streptomyces racemochromogenes]|uniref:hypothetical protein n=1 Tax=Streptomyces racemochromogenes TaxID=67353 RepID=UPI0031ED6ABA